MKKIFSILALLLMAVSGAWAQTERLLTTITPTGNTTYSETTPGAVTVTQNCEYYNSGYGWCFEFMPGSVTVEANEGYTISKCVYTLSNGSTTILTISTPPFKINFVWETYSTYCYCEGTDPNSVYCGVKSIQVYGYATVTANEGATGEYWATYYNGTTSFTADENTTVFQAALSGSSLTLTEVPNREIPATKAVILKSSSSSITLTPATTTATLEGNQLVGTATAITNPGNAYVLNYKAATGAGFYKLSASGTIGANKAYLTYSGSLAPEFFGFDGNTTSINEVRGKMEDVSGEYYDLQGRRVSQPTKGLYIVNGKKVIIK